MIRRTSLAIPASLFTALACGDAGSAQPGTAAAAAAPQAMAQPSAIASAPVVVPTDGTTPGTPSAEPLVPVGEAPPVSTAPPVSEPPVPVEMVEMPRPKLRIPNVQHLPVEAGEPVTSGQVVAETFIEVHNNQPSVLNGYLVLNGNADFTAWNIEDPQNPKPVAEMASQHNAGEAESHQVAYAKYGDKFYMTTTSGKGLDIWDMTEMEKPAHVSHLAIDGIDYGDVAGGVWGMAWQGNYIYIGGNDTGLHIVDATDPAAANVVKTLPNSETGGFFPGPLFALGNVLVITSPKGKKGIATLEIGDPTDPILLDSMAGLVEDSYVGWFFGGHVFLQTPLRVYDVLGDPTNIIQVGENLATSKSEYFSFGDDQMFLGLLRPNPGVVRFDATNMSQLVKKEKIEGRYIYKDDGEQHQNDDQFSLKVGNMLILSDDEKVEGKWAGTYIVVESEMPDTVAPYVKNISPKDGTNVRPTSAIGLAFSDQIELATVGDPSFIVRPVGGEPITGRFGHMRTILNFSPDAPMAPGDYEVVLPAGGISDLGGNPLATEFVSKFTVK